MIRVLSPRKIPNPMPTKSILVVQEMPLRQKVLIQLQIQHNILPIRLLKWQRDVGCMEAILEGGDKKIKRVSFNPYSLLSF